MEGVLLVLLARSQQFPTPL